MLSDAPNQHQSKGDNVNNMPPQAFQPREYQPSPGGQGPTGPPAYPGPPPPWDPPAYEPAGDVSSLWVPPYVDFVPVFLPNPHLFLNQVFLHIFGFIPIIVKWYAIVYWCKKMRQVVSFFNLTLLSIVILTIYGSG